MEDQSQNIKYTELIIRSLCDELSNEEQSILNFWLNEDTKNKKKYLEFKKTLEFSIVSETIQKINIESEWAGFRNKIYSKENNPFISKTNYSKYFKFAASILILAIITTVLIITFKQNNQIIVADNTKIEKTLIDGSVISLNSKSKITIPESFNYKTRNITLKGEAFFKVAKSYQKPFIVSAGNISIKVVGTEFYVNYNESLNTVEVIVSSGKVAVYETDKPDAVRYLEKGDRINYQNNLLPLTTDSVSNYNHISWETMYFEFNNETLSNVIKYINKAYNSNIKLKNNSNTNCTITVSFDNQNLESILNVLENTLNLKIEKNKKDILIIADAC